MVFFFFSYSSYLQRGNIFFFLGFLSFFKITDVRATNVKKKKIGQFRQSFHFSSFLLSEMHKVFHCKFQTGRWKINKYTIKKKQKTEHQLKCDEYLTNNVLKSNNKCVIKYFYIFMIALRKTLFHINIFQSSIKKNNFFSKNWI